MRQRAAVLFTTAYGAGLATGLLRWGDPWGGAGVVVLLGLLGMLRRPPVVLLASALLLGRLAAEVAWVGEAGRCSARLPAGEIRLSIRLRDPAGPGGGRIGVTPLRAACTGTVGAQWPLRRPLAAGHQVAVSAQWVPRPGAGGRPDGTLVVRRIGPVTGTPSFAERLRTELGGASRALYGARSPMVDALVLGTRGSMDRELQQRFAEAGLVHLLSISGFHVGLLAAWVVLLAGLARIPRDRAVVLGAIASTAYVAFLGWPPPATRAAALAALLARCRLRQRHVASDPLLAATCLVVMLVDPWAVLDLGAWLSAAALWGATAFTRWSDRTLGTGVLWRGLGSSVGATLATAPITAAALGTVAAAGVALNFAAIPLAAIAVPGVVASLLVFPIWCGLAGALAAGAGLGLRLLELLAQAGSGIPWGHTVQPAGLRSAAPWVAALGLALWGISGRAQATLALRRWAWAGTAGLWVVFLWSGGSRASGGSGSADGPVGLALHFLDVGQGDAAALRTPAGRWLLIDAGPRGRRYDAGRAVVVPFLLAHGVRQLALAVVSHAHADHLGGMPAVLDRFRSGLLIEPGEKVAEPLYLGLLDELAADAVPWHPGRTGERFELDGVHFTVLHPDPRWSGWGEDLNEDSLVLLVEYGAFQALFAGDAGFRAEAALRGRIPPVDLLKVGHHGSRGSTGEPWLAALHPRAAVISVGRGNDYGHPAPATLARLAEHGVRVWRTDRDGTISVTTDGRRMTVRDRAGEATFDVN